MTDYEIIELLRTTGHLGYPFGKKQDYAPPTLGLRDPAVERAIASYQEFNVLQLDPLSLEHHSRAACCDGDVGPATRRLLAMQRCGCADYGPDVQAATGSGSWAGCHDIGDFHAATAYVDDKGMPGFLKPLWDRVWAGAVAAYEQIGLRWILVDGPDGANTKISFVSRSRGWIGLARVGQSQSCSSEIWAQFLATYHPSNVLDRWTELLMHELGHNAGLQHTRGGIMHPSISGAPLTWIGDPSETILKRYYGGEPIDPRPEPPPRPPDTAHGLISMSDGREFDAIPERPGFRATDEGSLILPTGERLDVLPRAEVPKQ